MHQQQFPYSKLLSCTKFQIERTELPYDFIIDKDEWPRPEINKRLHNYGAQSFDKNNRAANIQTGKDIPDDVYEDFKQRLYNLRAMAIGFGKPCIKQVWSAGLKKYEKDYTFAGGRTVETPEDFAEALMSQPYNNEMRARLHYIQNRMWGTNNNWAILVVEKVKELMKIKYLDTNVYGKTPKKKYIGGCLKTIMVKLK